MSNRLFNQYRPDLKAKASYLRKNSTLSEVLLWVRIKNRQLLGYKFRRQKPVGRYILDLYCKELNLAIEIDGRSHDEKINYDEYRQTVLEGLGIKVLRFNDLEIKTNIETVIQRIVDWINANPPLPRPSGD